MLVLVKRARWGCLCRVTSTFPAFWPVIGMSVAQPARSCSYASTSRQGFGLYSMLGIQPRPRLKTRPSLLELIEKYSLDSSHPLPPQGSPSLERRPATALVDRLLDTPPHSNSTPPLLAPGQPPEALASTHRRPPYSRIHTAPAQTSKMGSVCSELPLTKSNTDLIPSEARTGQWREGP